MLYDLDNQHYFCLSSALFLLYAVARVEAFALGGQEKEVISEAEASSPWKFFRLEGYNSRGCFPEKSATPIVGRCGQSVEGCWAFCKRPSVGDNRLKGTDNKVRTRHPFL